jgi:hypothetical protein
MEARMTLNFDGMWYGWWEAFGGSTLLFWTPGNQSKVVHGFGSTGVSIGYSLNGHFDEASQSITGTWMSPMYAHDFNGDRETDWLPIDPSALGDRTGLYRFWLSKDGLTFKGAYNFRRDPNVWRALNGHRQGKIISEQTPDEVGPWTFESLQVPWSGGNPLL